jgi:dolichyl-diphosphooligosaccharide--protein glycosyltransferase
LLIAVAFILYYVKNIEKKELLTVLLSIFIVLQFSYFYFIPSKTIAESYGTVLSDNWFEALTWIKNNTAECSVVATYWDPGHFITGIAKRAVVFDGASQGTTRTIKVAGNLSEDEIKDIAVIGRYTSVYDPVKNITSVTTARIQDIATTLFTDNETLAVDILKKYVKPNCTEMYYIASSDLIGKSVWWSYFATWNPVDKGVQQSYFIASLSKATPMPSENAIVYTYPLSTSQAFVLYDTNGDLKAYLQQNNQFAKVEKIVYIKDNNWVQSVQNDSEIKGTLWVPGKDTVVYMRPELENSLFTRMFFYNGFDIKYFRFINNWGGEVKLFRVMLNETS